MFTNLLFVDNEMSSPTPVDAAAVKTTDFGKVDDKNGAVTETLNMVVEEIGVV